MSEQVPNKPRNEGRSVTGVLPKYELIDKNGIPCMVFDTALEAAKFAQMAWPDQEQDEDRTGRGWDVQVVGAE